MLQFSCRNFQESPLPFDESAGFTAPSAFGTYRVLHQIGSGVLGPVFRTYDPQRDRLVAIKAFRLDVVPEQAARLADALRRLAASPLTQPAVVPAIDAGLEGTTAYLASEYVAAETLDVALRHLAPASLEVALPLLSQMADAIDAAWAAGAGHGALHPRDVFVTVDGRDVRITGFGVVPALESVGIKTPIRRPYAAPERATGEAWDIRADVFSLGAIAHELLTRRRPAGSGEQDGALTTGTTAEQRVQIRRVLSVVLAERPDQRFQSARAFADALAAIAHGEPVTWPAADGAEPEMAAAEAVPEAARDLLDMAPVETTLANVPPVTVPDPATEAPARIALPPDARPAVVTVDDVEEEAEETEPAEPRRVWDLDQPAVEAALENPENDDEVDDGREGASPRRVELRRSDVNSPWHQPESPMAADVAETGPSGGSSFPWGALGAVAAAGIVVGIVIGYEFGVRQGLKSGSAPPVGTAAAETDVTVPATGPAAPASEVAEPDAAPVVRAAARKGRVVVRSTPPGALLTIDGRPHGQTPAAVDDLALGAHTIEVARSGYVPYTDTVILAAKNPARTVAVHLRPGLGSGGSAEGEAAAAAAGSIYVDSRPRQAKVLVDGRVIGTTPLRMPDVRAGSHVVRLELAGHQSFATRVGVKAGEEARVTAALEER